jgi:anti-anti-sigma factor
MEGPELDLMATHLSEELMRSKDKRMVLDCQRMKFLASAALSVIVGLMHLAKQFKGGLVVCGIQAQVKPVLRISGLDRHIPICGTREEAVAMLADPASGTP